MAPAFIAATPASTSLLSDTNTIVVAGDRSPMRCRTSSPDKVSVRVSRTAQQGGWRCAPSRNATPDGKGCTR